MAHCVVSRTSFKFYRRASKPRLVKTAFWSLFFSHKSCLTSDKFIEPVSCRTLRDEPQRLLILSWLRSAIGRSGISGNCFWISHWSWICFSVLETAVTPRQEKSCDFRTGCHRAGRESYLIIRWYVQHLALPYITSDRNTLTILCWTITLSRRCLNLDQGDFMNCWELENCLVMISHAGSRMLKDKFESSSRRVRIVFHIYISVLKLN